MCLAEEKTVKIRTTGILPTFIPTDFMLRLSCGKHVN